MPLTVIRDADMVVAWDAGANTHVYMPDADVAFEDGVLRFVGRGYDGPADTVVPGAGLMVMPGLVNIHLHPSSEPMNKGLIDEIGSPGFYNSSLYEVPADLPRRRGGGAALRARGTFGAAAVGCHHARGSVDGASGLARPAGRGGDARVRGTDVPLGALKTEQRAPGGIRLGRGRRREGDGRGAVADRARRAASVGTAVRHGGAGADRHLFRGIRRASPSPRPARAACPGRSTPHSRSANSTRSPAGTVIRRSAGWIISGCCRNVRSSATASFSTTIPRRAGTPIPT